MDGEKEELKKQMFWTGRLLGKVDQARKEQKYYASAIILLQIVTLIIAALSLLR